MRQKFWVNRESILRWDCRMKNIVEKCCMCVCAIKKLTNIQNFKQIGQVYYALFELKITFGLLACGGPAITTSN